MYAYDWLDNDRVTLQVVDSLDDASGNIQLRARLAINTDGTGQREMAGYRMLRELTDKPGSVIVLGPGRSNWLSWGSKVPHRVLVTSSSDTYPGGYFVLDTRNNKMERLAERRPWVDEEKMSPMQRMQYAARDGLMIPAMLTLPKSAGGKSAKNLPLVVDIHGGPLAPGAYWGYNETAQFLASRRYAVLQPSFRGSTGYGRKYLEAGYKQ